MAMNHEEFKKYDQHKKKSLAAKIIECLLEARKEGCYSLRAIEIAKRIDANPYSVSAKLGELKRRGIIVHKQPEWALADGVVDGEDKNNREGNEFEHE